ncbi:FecR family protein [Chitinophaga caseinilytica]|uniref:FecR family protein n=1 Tax=Chitinophaga caseinilytica TaxID=2267521 RepID=UPI003C30B96D
MEDPRIQELLDKHAANACTPEELAELHRWYDGFPQRGTPEGKAAAGREMKQTVFDAIGGTVAVSARRRAIRTWSAAAAAVAMLAGGWWMFRQQHVAPVIVEVRVPAGDSSRNIQLPDGSRAWLAAGSTIRYREGFAGGDREVELPDGQVFFEVGPSTEKPFRVITGKGLEVKVLGTGFTVTSWPELPQTDVYVASGAVQVSDSAGVVGVLRAKEGLGYERGKPVHKTTGDQPDPRSGTYQLKEADFATVAAFVKRRFGLELRYDPATMREVRFNAIVEGGMTAPQFFDMLQLLSGIPWKQEGNTVSFFNS